MTASSKRQKREEYRQTHKEEGGNRELPKKKFYRQRAHANPFSDHQLAYPISPSEMDWSPYYPAFVDSIAARDILEGRPKPITKRVTVADIGCGFGGLLIALAPMLPDELILGLEIRTQVTEYVQDRISALRTQHSLVIGDQDIVFPGWTVRNHKYITHPTPVQIDRYIIMSTANNTEETVAQTEIQLKQIIGIKSILSYPDAESHRTYWIANPTPDQVVQIENLEGVDAVSRNERSDSDRQKRPITRFYSPTTQSITTSAPLSPYANISVLRANTMKFLPNFFTRGQLTHIFLCFPDPHFKARKHKARIVSSTLCAEYAYVMQPGGCIYTITDVEELANWMKERFAEFAGGEIFERVEIPDEGREEDWIDDESEGGKRREVARMVRCIREETEEGKKVTRNGGNKFVGVWRRREDPKWPDEYSMENVHQ